MPDAVAMRGVGKARGPSPAWVAVRRALVLAGVASLTACSWMQSHSRGGVAWNKACEAHPNVGCACHVSKDCETNWCVAGECEHYPP